MLNNVFNLIFNNQTYFLIKQVDDLNNTPNVLVFRSHNGYVVLIGIYSFIIFENVTSLLELYINLVMFINFSSCF